MRRAAALLVLLALFLAGCTGAPQPTSTPPGKAPPAREGPFTAPAPWWDVGDAYTVRLERAGEGVANWRMVNFWNDTATEHFWLGVEDRRQALDMALFDTNPFMGRIHHHILTPHERGMHAAMYSFPLADGKTWSGFFFGKNWSFQVREARLDTAVGRDRGFTIEGASADGDGGTIRYDYSPASRWFSRLEQRDGAGRLELAASVEAYERGATGEYVFLRGRDFYRGPDVGGTHDESFEVREAVDGLAFHVDARASGPLEVQLLDPSGNVRARATAATGGTARLTEEVQPAPQGRWAVRYVATGAISGTVLATGLLETSQRLP